MADFDALRQDLAASLIAHADHRRVTTGERQLTGEDIKIIALLERLAEGVKRLDADALGLSEPMTANLRIPLHGDLLAQVGVLYWPANATDLVRWLLAYVGGDPQPPFIKGDPFHPGHPSASGGGSDNTSLAPASVADRPRPLTAMACDFTAGFGIVAPLLALREAGTGIAQWRDHAFADEHAVVSATILSVEPGAGLRTSDLAKSVVLSFQPTAASNACQVPVQLHRVQELAPGATVLVVPRSNDCEAPLVRSEIGDPHTTFLLAAALLVGGLAALKCWDCLAGSHARALERQLNVALGRLPTFIRV